MKKQEKTSLREMISDWFSQYTLDYPNLDPDKISVYAVGWICIALMGLCVMFADIPAGILLIVLLGLILTGVMLWKNPEVFKISPVRKVPWIISAYTLTYIPTLAFAILYWLERKWIYLSACIISTLLISLLLFYILYRWQRKGSTEDALKQLQMEQNQSFSSLQEQVAKSAEELKQKLHPDIKYAELDRWATVPDSVTRILEILEDEGYYSQRALAKISPDTIRIKIQKRLKESHAEEKRANNANFYKTIDIAAEAAQEFSELPATTILAELNFIASSGDNLQRAKKQKVQRSSEDSGKK